MPQACDLRARLGQFSGHATRVRGDLADGIATFHPQATALQALAKGLRDTFDPRNILNCGLM